MAYNPNNPNGQATSANSAPVVLASDQSTLPVGGNVASGSADSGNPVKIAGKVATSIPTPVSNATRVDAWFDEYGRQVISDKDTELGLSSGTTGLRDRLVAQRMTVLSDSLIDGIAGFWTRATANGGTITNTGGEGLLKTSTATNGSSQLSSTTVAYYPGQVAWLNSAIRFGDTGTAGDIRRLGMFTVSGTTPQDGFYFELNGTTLNAVYVKAGVATATDSTTWSRVSQAPFTLDTNYHSFEIRYTANSVWFYIDNVLRHQVSGTSSPLTTTLTLPITITNVKTSGATDITLAIRNIGNGRFGHPGGVVNETGLSAVEALSVGGGTPNDSVDSGNPLKIGGYAKSSAPTAVQDGDRVNAWFTQNGALNIAAPAISTGGYSKIKYAAQTTTVQTVKATQGKLGGYMIYNPNATVAYVQLFDVASATTVTLGTTVPDVILPIPATSGANVMTETGIDFTNGIKLACTTTATGSTAPGTGLDMSVFYK